MEFEAVVRSRRSIRAFSDRAITREMVHDLLEIASRAPSGTNVQPWKVYVVTGHVRDQLKRAVLDHRETTPPDVDPEFMKPKQRKEPYVSRMRTLGKEMYSRLEIPRGDAQATWRQWGRNYGFFDAPVGLILTVDKELDVITFLDVGAFMQTFMLAAKDRGLDTCAQGAWSQYWSATRRLLGISDQEFIVSGMSLGYADDDHPVNGVVAAREPVEEFANFLGFSQD